jgi:hypothetical protein
MGEVKNFMAELDEWIESRVIEPLFAVWKGQDEVEGDPQSYKGVELTTYGVRRAIRDKVLESYRNGQNAPQKPFQRSYSPRK